ncbi:hypothetical protein [Clostridium sartagoforme]|uniref:hypothetical protein n=1 Tax=Clostridium sartagoforme TaxID=84031 RepID=UPI0003A0D45C|nr:hypothetical protein [Clostridium sartagoforme]
MTLILYYDKVLNKERNINNVKHKKGDFIYENDEKLLVGYLLILVSFAMISCTEKKQ